MTVEELMKLADAYAAAAAARAAWSSDPAQTYANWAVARAALEEAMSLTSQFGGL